MVGVEVVSEEDLDLEPVLGSFKSTEEAQLEDEEWMAKIIEDAKAQA